MTIIAARIHPAIGIARVGDSEKGSFTGPERRWDPALPPGETYRDDDGRIRRQAARFRVFAHHDDRRVEELTAATAEITWTVHLANRKAVARRLLRKGAEVDRNANYRPPRRDGLIVDAGPQRVSGPGQAAVRLAGTFTVDGHDPAEVYLGEISTDADGHLVVLGGRGAAGSPSHQVVDGPGDSAEWFDDISDGPVSATVRIGGRVIDAEGARVIVGPPKFAPPIGNVVRLWDALFDAFAGDAAKAAQPSYVRDIFPILQAAADTGAVDRTARGRHRFAHPVTDAGLKADILRRVTTAGPGHMPMLKGDPGRDELSLTRTQIELIRRWAAGDCADDWPAGADFPPADEVITPEGLDRAALENCAGRALTPGVEAGKFLLERQNYVGDFTVGGAYPSFRLRPDVPPGAVTAGLSLPWQADFHYCRDWWPAERPDQVVPEGALPGSDPVEWARDAEQLGGFVAGSWAKLGFVVRRGTDLVETERTL